jgi:cell division protein ZapB
VALRSRWWVFTPKLSAQAPTQLIVESLQSQLFRFVLFFQDEVPGATEKYPLPRPEFFCPRIAMTKTQELAERVERLLLRYQELQRTHQLLTQQLSTVSLERNSLRSRLNAARGRIDALLERLPAADLAVPTAAPAGEHP